MRFAITLLLFWAIASGLWAQFVYSGWHQGVEPNLVQIAALDKCDAVYPPRADGYATQYSDSWSNWESIEERNHPECAPVVGALGFFQFVTMAAPQRAALRQNAENEINAATHGAIIAGACGPPVLLVFGLALFWLVRSYRSR